MPRRPFFVALRFAAGILAVAAVPVAEPANTAAAALDQQFTHVVHPLLEQYCVTCHSGVTPAAGFDLSAYTGMESVVHDNAHWGLLIDKLTSKQMPPSPMPAPTDRERLQLVDWVKALRTEEAQKYVGDPGPVLARRLSNSEYNYTIRDLTGVDIQPTRQFPVDPANQAGFDNSGESLTMSPALLNKYLQAAHEVADHMVLTPDSLAFATTPMLVETDKDKYTITRIVDFYFSQPTDFADYFAAAWRYKHRVALGKPAETLAKVAADSKVSPKYLPVVWQLLEETPQARKQEVGPIKKLQTMWLALPAPGAGGDAGSHKAKTEPARENFTAMRDFVARVRLDTGMQYAAPIVKGLPGGSEALMDWKLDQFAAHHRDSDPAALRNDEDPPPVVAAIPKYPGLHQDGAPHWAAVIAKSRAADSDLIVPKAQHARYQESFERFAQVFPDAFFVSERGRYFPDDTQDKGRFLSAGYHNVMGYYRDDTALRELILDEKGRQQIDRLWNEFDFIAQQTERTWVQWFFNQSGEVAGKGDEGGSPRPVDHEVTDQAVIDSLRDLYVSKAEGASSNDPVAAAAVRQHFERVNNVLRSLEKEHAGAEPKHLDALLKFAARAYRRPLTKAESDDTLAYYHQLRDKNGLSHEDAIRDSVVSVLMSPDFLYRIDLSASTRQVLHTVAARTPASSSGTPLASYALASRLSYFLWSSMPDDELLAHAASGDLENPAVLLAQTRRMLKDDRSKDFATEFGGNWLEFRRFENHNGVDRERFHAFNNDLREAMFQEPVRFIQDVIQHDRSVFDMLYGKYTFVNPVLAKFYGIPAFPEPAPAPKPVVPAGGPGRGVLPPADQPPPAKPVPDIWVRVDDADKYQRGGLLPMAVFLTQNSPGLRTSPVKRGHWLVSKVLGEVIPPPPPVVPELPNDEAKSDLPIRELLAQHRANPVCGSCHARFDVFGLALESYGPVGETRTKDLGGRPINSSATLPGNVEEVGLTGVQQYIREHRQKGFVDGLSRKLLSYALDRSLILSDESLVDTMEAKLTLDNYKFDSLVETIVASPQFRNRRGTNVTVKTVAPTKAKIEDPNNQVKKGF